MTFVDAASRRPVGEPYRLRDGNVQSLDFSPDGRTLAVAGHEPPTPASSGLVDLVDTRTHERRARIVLPPFPDRAQYVGLNVLYPARRPRRDRRADPRARTSTGRLRVLRRFDGETGAAEGPPLRVGRHSSLGMSATADRQRLFVTSPEDDETHHDRRRIAARRCSVGPPETSPGPSAPTGACSRSARRRATSACSTCAQGVSGASRGATRDPSTRCASRPTGGRS